MQVQHETCFTDGIIKGRKMRKLNGIIIQGQAQNNSRLSKKENAP